MIPDCCTKGTALEGWSATSTPTNWTVEPLACSAFAVWARRGVSFWQGVHHEAKKLSTTGRLRSLPSASRLTGAPPRSAGRVKSGATLPTPTTGPELESGFEPVPSTKKRKAARAAAMITPMARERRRLGGLRTAAGGVGGDSGGGAFAAAVPASVNAW